MFGADFEAGCPSLSLIHISEPTRLGMSLSTATGLRWGLLFLGVASLFFLIVKRLDRIGAIFGYFKKEIERWNTE